MRRPAGLLLLLLTVLATGCVSSRREATEPEIQPLDRDVVAKIHAGEIWFSGGDGSSFDQAIVVGGAADATEGVLAEYEYLQSLPALQQTEWKRLRQKLISRELRMYDVITIRTADGDRDFYFDAGEYYGLQR